MISIDDQIQCVAREIAMRQRVYTRRVQAGQMDPDEADREIETMKAVLETLKTHAPTQQMSLLKGEKQA